MKYKLQETEVQSTGNHQQCQELWHPLQQIAKKKKHEARIPKTLLNQEHQGTPWKKIDLWN